MVITLKLYVQDDYIKPLRTLNLVLNKHVITIVACRRNIKTDAKQKYAV